MGIESYHIPPGLQLECWTLPGLVTVNGDDNSGLIVAVKCGMFHEGREDFPNKVAKPDGFFSSISGGNLFGFSS